MFINLFFTICSKVFQFEEAMLHNKSSYLFNITPAEFIRFGFPLGSTLLLLVFFPIHVFFFGVNQLLSDCSNNPLLKMVLQNGTLHNEHSNIVDTLLLFLRPFPGVILETEGRI